ncbi:MAG: carboxypeptidase regulatory-like domain-containing protein [Methanomassiliicoccales archaeon]
MALNNTINSDARRKQEQGQDTRTSGFYTLLRQLDWPAFAAILVIVLIATYLRFYFDFSSTLTGGFPSLSGGSDADFYFDVLSYALHTGHQMLFDPMLNYPLGSNNPFLPFYVWSTVMITWPVAFLFHLPVITPVHSTAISAAVVAFSAISAISGIVASIIAYFLGKELFSREAGIIAAALVAVLPSFLSESTAGFGVHDPFVLMLTALFFFFTFRALNTVNGVRWVERWNVRGSFKPDFESIGKGLHSYYQENKRSLIYAFMSGIVLASIANAWEGFSYIVVIVSLFYLIQSFIYKFRNRDTLALSSIYLVQNMAMLIFSFDVYYQTASIYPWFYVGILFFLGTLLLGVIYTITRDVPWLTVLVSLAVALLLVFGGLEVLDKPFLHGLVQKVLLAQSYFIKSPVYTTIAEALAPSFSLLVLSLGGAIFFIAFAQMLYMFYKSPRKLSNSHVLLIIWFIIATFMAVTTVRFVLDATTTFALMSAEGLVLLLEWVNFGEVRKGISNFGLSWTGIRRSVKIKHILAVLFVAFVICMPVSWMAIDAATPSTMKQSLNTQVYDLLPSFLHPPGYVNNGSNPYYFGGFGYSLESPNTYFPAAWSWLDNYTSNIASYSERPAYLSWWDYGSEVVTFAQVPTVADDFQQGYHLASAFLFSQNETQAVALLAARLMYGSFEGNGSYLSPAMYSLLQSYGINASYVQNVMQHPGNYKSLVLSEPSIYGPFSSDVTSPSVMYAVLMVVLSRIGLNQVVNLYQTISKLTGKFIDFFSVDSRLIPFSATDTGVFYAPAFLGGRPVAGPGVYNIPYNYYTITATTTTGLTYPLQSIPPGSQVSSYSINYQPLFYNMTLYRMFFGYSGYDLTGQNISGLPGLSGDFTTDPQISNYQPLPGWMMSHFEMVYRTAYYNPWPLKYVAAHPNAWVAIDYSTAIKLIKENPSFTNYTVDLSPTSDFENGIVLMQYFPGAFVNGTVLLSNGKPASGIRVTILDQWGIPHDVVYTNAQGKYSAVAVAGNDTVVLSTGPLTSVQENLSQTGLILKQYSINVSQAAALRDPVINMSTGLPAYDMNMGTLVLNQTGMTGHVFFKAPANYTFSAQYSVPVKGVTVLARNATSGQTYAANVSDSGFYNFSALLPGEYEMFVQSGSELLHVNNVSLSYGETSTVNLALTPYYVNGTIVNLNNTPVGKLTVKVSGAGSNYSEYATTSPNGTFSAGDLIEGNYTVTIAGGEYTMQSPLVTPAPLNTTMSYGKLVLRALQKGELTGSVQIGGTFVPDATVIAYGNEYGLGTYSATTSSTGNFSMVLPNGNYTLYSIYFKSSVPYAILSAVNVSGGQHVSLHYLRAYWISGIVTGSDGAPVQANIYFERADAVLNITTAQNGSYAVAIPSGNYSVMSQGNGGYLGSVAVQGHNVHMNINEQQSLGYKGNVYTELTGKYTNISAPMLEFNSGGSNYIFFGSVTGSYSLQLPAGNSYLVNFSAPGYTHRSVSLSTSTLVNVELFPSAVEAHFEIAGELPPGGSVYLSPVNDSSARYFPIVSGAVATISLPPGTYMVNATGFNTSTYRTYAVPGNVTLSVGQSTSLAINFHLLYNQTLRLLYPSGVPKNSNASRVDVFGTLLPQPLSFSNMRTGEGIYLQAGSYTIYSFASVNGTEYASLSQLNVTSVGTAQVNFRDAFDLSGTLYYNGSTVSPAIVNVVAVSNGNTVKAAVLSNGTFDVTMPEGNYTVMASKSANMLYNGVLRYVMLSAVENVSLNENLSLSLTLSPHLSNVTLSGTVRMFYGLPVQAELYFVSKGGTAINTSFTTLQNGSYSASLAPGNYTVEVYSTDGQASNISTIYVSPSPDNFNPTLNFAYLVSGTVSADGIGSVNASIQFKSSTGNFTITSSGGRFSLLLPAGVYSLNATYNVTIQGTLYKYAYSSNVSVSSASVMSIPLSLVPTYSVSLKVLSYQNSPGTAGFDTVRLLVNNTGDVPDVVFLAVDTPHWFASFDPTYLLLGTGNASSATVNVTLSSFNPAGGTDSVTFSAYSYISPKVNASTSVNVAVPVVYGYSASFSSYGTEVPGRVETFTIVVNNTGNSKANFVATMSNLPALRSEGWNGGIYTTSSGPFYNITYFTLNPGQNQTLTVQLRAYGTNASTIIPATVTVTERETGSYYAVSVPLSLPNPVVSLSGITVSGAGSSASHPPLITPRLGVIIFILAALIIAIVYVAKRKRLIR